LPNADVGLGALSDPYCTVTMGDVRLLRTKCLENEPNPQWNEFVDFQWDGESSIHFLVADFDRFSDHENLGQFVLEPDQLTKEVKDTFKLELLDYHAYKKRAAAATITLSCGPRTETKFSNLHRPGECYSVEIEKPDSGLQLAFCRDDDAELLLPSMVVNVGKGPLYGLCERWDRIVEVNGYSGAMADMQSLIMENSLLKFKFRRPEFYTVDFVPDDGMDGSRWGLRLIPLNYQRDHEVIELHVITNIFAGGAADRYNAANPEKALKPFDCITEINGKSRNMLSVTTLPHHRVRFTVMRQYEKHEVRVDQLIAAA